MSGVIAQIGARPAERKRIRAERQGLTQAPDNDSIAR
jgi:hypothetical protein